jgi:hypothetical protein
MKKYILGLLLVILTTSCVAQEQVKEERSIILPNAFVSQVSKEAVTLTYLGRVYETDGTYVKGKKYYAALKIVDCDGCGIIKAVTEFNHISVEQTRDNIRDAMIALKEAKE